jgi:hypothetical protein
MVLAIYIGSHSVKFKDATQQHRLVAARRRARVHAMSFMLSLKKAE